jgi:hypothetical protein
MMKARLVFGKGPKCARSFSLPVRLRQRPADTIRMRAILSLFSFLVIFILGFFLGGWFLMPHLPPVPDHPVSALELEYWTTNWAGTVLGLLLAGLSAWSSARRNRPTDPMPALRETDRISPR